MKLLNLFYHQVKTLGEDSDEEGISSWVMKSREKEKALKIEKELNEAGDEFGLGDLVKKEFKPKERDYTEKDLKVFVYIKAFNAVANFFVLTVV